MNRSRIGKVAGASVLVGALAAGAAPALADGNTGSLPITYGLSPGCTACRTLVLENSDESTPVQGLNLSSGSGGFIAKVEDSGIDPAALGNFWVTATMSNLYEYANGQYDCSVSIPSSDLSLSSSPSLLDANGLKAAVQPVFSLTGDLTKVSLPVLLTPLTQVLSSSTTQVTGDVTTLLNQAALSGNSALDLIGSMVPSNLPLGLGTGGGSFTSPDAPPSPTCTSSGAAATPVKIMSGTLNETPLLGEVQTQLKTVSLANLIQQGFLTQGEALTDIENATNISPNDFAANPALFSLLEPAFSATVSGLVSGVTTLTGNYSASPLVSIKAPGATPATYQGMMTVTLTSGNPPAGLGS